MSARRGRAAGCVGEGEDFAGVGGRRIGGADWQRVDQSVQS